MTGLIYLAHRESDGLYKIGYSANPKRRLSALKPRSTGTTMVHTIPSADPYEIEQFLHIAFDAVLVSGEWFALTADHVTQIRSILRCDGIGDIPDDVRSLHRANTLKFRSAIKTHISLLVEERYKRAFCVFAAANGLTLPGAFRRLIETCAPDYLALVDDYDARHPRPPKRRKSRKP